MIKLWHIFIRVCRAAGIDVISTRDVVETVKDGWVHREVVGSPRYSLRLRGRG